MLLYALLYVLCSATLGAKIRSEHGCARPAADGEEPGSACGARAARVCNDLLARARRQVDAGRWYDAETALRECIREAGSCSSVLWRAEAALADVRSRAGYACKAVLHISNLVVRCPDVPKHAVVVYARALCRAGACARAFQIALRGIETYGIADCSPHVDPLLCSALAHLSYASPAEVQELHHLLGREMKRHVRPGKEPLVALLAAQRFLLRRCYPFLSNEDDRATVWVEARAAATSDYHAVVARTHDDDGWSPARPAILQIHVSDCLDITSQLMQAFVERVAESAAGASTPPTLFGAPLQRQLDLLDGVLYDGYQGSFVVASALALRYARQAKWHRAHTWCQRALANVGSSRGHPERLAQLLMNMAMVQLFLSNDLASFDYYAQWAHNTAPDNDHVANALALLYSQRALQTSRTNDAIAYLARRYAHGVAELPLLMNLADMYEEAGVLDKAMEARLAAVQRALCEENYSLAAHCLLVLHAFVQQHRTLDDHEYKSALARLPACIPSVPCHSRIIQCIVRLQD